MEMLQSLAQRPAPANTNRERRPRYQHPKGAPNADLIFKTEILMLFLWADFDTYSSDALNGKRR
ncbi:hypothetical protein EK904_012695 [Melospiza melodia maxima]|nr:hypothetical protein EK904_012695 [Melospiza melodia maxima]